MENPEVRMVESTLSDDSDNDFGFDDVSEPVPSSAEQNAVSMDPRVESSTHQDTSKVTPAAMARGFNDEKLQIVDEAKLESTGEQSELSVVDDIACSHRWICCKPAMIVVR